MNPLVELAAEINNTLLINPYKKDLDYYKLQPTQVDRMTFYDLIYFRPTTTQNKIVNAYQFFDRKLQQKGIDIRKLKKVITDQFMMA